MRLLLKYGQVELVTDTRGVPLGLVRAHPLLVVGPNYLADRLALVDVRPGHLVEVDYAGTEDY